jgi:hypothetical protein
MRRTLIALAYLACINPSAYGHEGHGNTVVHALLHLLESHALALGFLCAGALVFALLIRRAVARGRSQ